MAGRPALVGMSAALAACLLLVPPAGARASCPMCSTGTQTLGIPGSEIPFDGRLRLGLGARSRSVDYGGVAVDELRFDASASWAPIAALVLSADVPVVYHGASDGTWAAGLGNVQVSGRVVVVRDRCFAPRHLLSLTAGVLLPAPTTGGQTLPSSMRLAPGAPALGASVGVSYVGHADDFSLTASIGGLAWLDGPGSTRLGPSLAASVGLSWQLTSAVAVRLASDVRVDAPSTALGGVDPSSGGVVLSAGPDLVFGLGDRVVLMVGARVPWFSADAGNRVERLSLAAAFVVDV